MKLYICSSLLILKKYTKHVLAVLSRGFLSLICNLVFSSFFFFCYFFVGFFFVCGFFLFLVKQRNKIGWFLICKVHFMSQDETENVQHVRVHISQELK
jgi:hypothetical protein